MLKEYYEKYFKSLCNTGINSKGSRSFHKQINKLTHKKQNAVVVEIGAGEGEHLIYCGSNTLHSAQKYLMVDTRNVWTKAKENLTSAGIPIDKIEYIQASVEDLPIRDCSVDTIIVTCLLHHIVYPEKALDELVRILRPGGQLIVGMPTDSGILNFLVKKLFTFRRARKLGISNIELIYALEHRNQIQGLINILRSVLLKGKLSTKYWPTFLPSTNLNLAVFICWQKVG